MYNGVFHVYLHIYHFRCYYSLTTSKFPSGFFLQLENFITLLDVQVSVLLAQLSMLKWSWWIFIFWGLSPGLWFRAGFARTSRTCTSTVCCCTVPDREYQFSRWNFFMLFLLTFLSVLRFLFSKQMWLWCSFVLFSLGSQSFWFSANLSTLSLTLFRLFLPFTFRMCSGLLNKGFSVTELLCPFLLQPYFLMHHTGKPLIFC